MMTSSPKKKSIHYVNNAEFSQAVVDYCTDLKDCKESGADLPRITNYIASCFVLQKVFRINQTLFGILIEKKW